MSAYLSKVSEEVFEKFMVMLIRVAKDYDLYQRMKRRYAGIKDIKKCVPTFESVAVNCLWDLHVNREREHANDAGKDINVLSIRADASSLCLEFYEKLYETNDKDLKELAESLIYDEFSYLNDLFDESSKSNIEISDKAKNTIYSVFIKHKMQGSLDAYDSRYLFNFINSVRLEKERCASSVIEK